ncbi:MAG: glycosyltransferase [bacterium]
MTDDCKPIRVCFYSSHVYPLIAGHNKGFGGAELDLYNVASALAVDPRFYVEVVTQSDEIERPTRYGALTVRPIRPRAVIDPSISPLKRLREIILFYPRMAVGLYQSKADVYFVKIASIESCLTWLVAALRRKPVVFRMSHDWEINPRDLKENIFSGEKWRADMFIHCLKRMSAVVCQTQNQRDALESNFAVESQIVLNSHLIPPSLSEQITVDNRTDILWVGRAHPMKLPEVFLDLARRLPHRHFVMICPPTAGQSKFFSEIKNSAELLPNITFIPGVGHDEMRGYYQKARALVITSEAEGFPNVLIESLKYGAPVASYLINPDGILSPMSGSDGDQGIRRKTEASFGYSADGHLEAITEWIEELFKDDDYWLECSRIARRYAQDHFAVEKNAEAYKLIFLRVVAGRSHIPVRICFYSSHVFPLIAGHDKGFGGAELDLYNVASALACDADFNVEIVTQSNEISRPTRYGALTVSPVQPRMPINVSVSRLRRLREIVLFYPRTTSRLMKSRADIYYVKIASLESCLTWLVATLRRKPVVFRTSSEWEINPESLKNIIFSGITWRAKLFTYCLKRMTFVICQTRQQRETLSRNFAVTAFPVRNSHRMPNLPPEANDANKRTDILWVGRAHPMKLPEVFLELARRMPHRNFVMVAPPTFGHEDCFTQIKQAADRLPNVAFIPGVGHDEVPSFYLKARVSVLTSEAEGFPNVVIESFKYGAPVICYLLNPDNILRPLPAGDDIERSPPVADAIGYAANGGIEAMLGEIERLFDDEEHWRECSRLARGFAEENYSVDTTIREYKSIFMHLIDDKHEPHG